MKQLNFSSLRIKALLLGLLPAVVMSLLVGGFLIEARLDDVRQALQSRGQALANELAASSVYGLFSGDTGSLQGTARKFLQQTDIASITIRSATGDKVLQLSNPELLKTRTPGELSRREPSNRLYRFHAKVAGIQSSQPIDAEDEVSDGRTLASEATLGSVEVVLADRSLNRLQRDVLSTALLLILGGIVVTALLALLMSQRVIRPILALSNAADRLRQGDLSARVERHSRDEIGILEEGFNQMAERIALTQDELTAEVDQAVSDLQTTMDALEVRNIELDLARKRALKASRAKSDFLALISHEIRTPMNGIIGFSRLLGRSPLDSAQIQQLKAIQDSADNLLAIINDVLDFSKLESGRISFHIEPFRLRKLIGGVTLLFDQQASEKGLELRQLVYDDVPDLIEGDSLRVRQVLINLLSNAIKFTPRGQITLRVMLDGTDEDELITFSVQDTGIGISPEAAERLFQPFTQADGATDREYGGTGLGLSISRKLVEGMQGRIDFDSTPGEGSTFRFSLPLRRPEGESEPVMDHTRGHAAPTEGGQRLDGLRILVADDNPINLELAQAILDQQGAMVTTAATGAETLSLAERQGYDLILMDVHMPVMNGVEAARRIRAGTGPNTNTPIVAITADVMAENQQHLFHAGMSEVLLKPVDEQKLLDVISDLLNLPEEQRQAGTVNTPSPYPDSMVDPDKLPIRDQEAALKTAAGNAEIANKLFEMLVSSLDEEIGEIRQLRERLAWDPLWDRVHKLLGASAACGVPALHATLQQLEAAIVEKETGQTQALIAQLVERAKQLHNGG